MTELVLSSLALFTAGVSLVILWFYRYKADKMIRYTYLANKWYDIKEKEFTNPQFSDPSKTSSYKTSFTGNELRIYETFAWICWGHAEDIYFNKWHNNPSFKPSIKYYKKMHCNWLKETANGEHFDPRFIEYVDKLR